MEAHVPYHSELMYFFKVSVNIFKICVYLIALVSTTCILFQKDDYSKQTGMSLYVSQLVLRIDKFKMAGVCSLQKMLNVQLNRTETLLQPLGHSDLESDNVPVLVNSTSSTPIRRTMLSSLQGQSEAGILDKPP